MSSLAGLLNHLRARLEAEGVPFVIGGAFALAAHGHPRFTDDLDVMVLTQDLAPVHRALGPPRFEFINEVTFRDAETGLLVDIIPVALRQQLPLRGPGARAGGAARGAEA